MFKCQVTGKVSQPGEKMFKVIVSKNPKVYIETRTVDGESVDVEVSKGWEIGKELCVSEEGLMLFNASQSK